VGKTATIIHIFIERERLHKFFLENFNGRRSIETRFEWKARENLRATIGGREVLRPHVRWWDARRGVGEPMAGSGVGGHREGWFGWALPLLSDSRRLRPVHWQIPERRVAQCEIEKLISVKFETVVTKRLKTKCLPNWFCSQWTYKQNAEKSDLNLYVTRNWIFLWLHKASVAQNVST
jgi:hypothetical protein